MKGAPTPESVHFERHPETGAETLQMSNCTRLMTWYHENYSFGNIVRESGDALIRGNVDLWHAGLTALAEPGDCFKVTKVYGPGTFQIVFLPPFYVEQTARELGLVGWPHIDRYRIGHPEAFQGLGRLFRCLRGDASVLEKQSRLALYTQLMLERYSESKAQPVPPRREPRAIRKAKSILQERYAESINLDTLAREVGLSKFHLLRSFAREVGVPPHAFQIQVRISRARELLHRGVPPALAAVDAGFSDQSHLNRSFKRHRGLTVGEYLKQVRSS